MYLCYGIHHLFNVVTNVDGLADAVLIRGVEPVANIELMKERRGANVPYKKLSAGPGTLSKALGIHTILNGADLLSNTIWISSSLEKDDFTVVSDKRIGVDYAGTDALLPWRFYIKESDFVSVRSN